MSGISRPQEKFVYSRIQTSEEYATLKTVGKGEGRLQILI